MLVHQRVYLTKKKASQNHATPGSCARIVATLVTSTGESHGDTTWSPHFRKAFKKGFGGWVIMRFQFHVISGYHSLKHHVLLLFCSIWPAFSLDIQRPKLREFFMNPSHSPPTCQSHRKKQANGESIPCIPIQSVYPVMFDGWLPYKNLISCWLQPMIDGTTVEYCSWFTQRIPSPQALHFLSPGFCWNLHHIWWLIKIPKVTVPNIASLFFYKSIFLWFNHDLVLSLSQFILVTSPFLIMFLA